MKVVIRDFRDSDMEDVIGIWLDASTEAHDFVDRQFWQSKVGDMRDTYIPASETYIYEDEEGIKGFFSFCGNALAAIFVAPGHQGEGVGRKLIQKAKELRDEFELRVYKDNGKAVRFYEMCGLKRVSEEVDEHTGHLELVMKFGS